jgi:hypothetical protein
MPSPVYAYVVAFTMLAVCGSIAITFVKIVNKFDSPEPRADQPESDVHAHAA